MKASYLAGWQGRIAKEREKRRAFQRRAWVRLDIHTQELMKRWRIRRARVFGSLVHGLAKPGSDIDMAVDGLVPQDYFAALADFEERLRMPVDLVRA